MSVPLDSPFPPRAKHMLGHGPNSLPLVLLWRWRHLWKLASKLLFFHPHFPFELSFVHLCHSEWPVSLLTSTNECQHDFHRRHTEHQPRSRCLSLGGQLLQLLWLPILLIQHHLCLPEHTRQHQCWPVQSERVAHVL